MQSENRMFDDLVKMMNGFAGTAAGMGRETQGSMREKMREWSAGWISFSRDEFDAVKAMAPPRATRMSAGQADCRSRLGQSPPPRPSRATRQARSLSADRDRRGRGARRRRADRGARAIFRARGWACERTGEGEIVPPRRQLGAR